MHYRKIGNKGDEISILGFGSMRLPIKGSNFEIDEEKASKMLIYAIENGVNYIDTAYFYHSGDEKYDFGGFSEIFIGNFISGKYGFPENLPEKTPESFRENIFIATKLPIYLIESKDDALKIFNTQLKKLKTDYIDFYLLHDVKRSSWKTVLDYDLISFLKELKKEGKINYIGFSFHDDFELFKEVIDSFDWDFCQIQYNYVDTKYQAGEAGLNYAHSKEIPVFIMEPLKGGRLSGEPFPEIRDLMGKSENKRSPTEWGLRFLWDNPKVTMLLSGMSEPEHVFENVKIAKEDKKLNLEEIKIMKEIQKIYDNKNMIGCTDCKYCMPCAAGVDIPKNIKFVEEFDLYGLVAGVLWSYKREIKKDIAGSNCIDCGHCLDKCPQEIDIPYIMKRSEEIFES